MSSPAEDPVIAKAAPPAARAIVPAPAGPRAVATAVAVRFLGLAGLDSAARDSMLEAVARGRATTARERVREIMAPVVEEQWRRWAAVRARARADSLASARP